MSNTYRTPHFDMPIPTGTDYGPDYANNISASGSSSCLYLIGEHTHDGVNSGPLINIAGQTITNDLSLAGYNLTNSRALRGQNNSSSLIGINDLNELYVLSGDWWAIDGNGNQIRITQNGALAVASFPGLLKLNTEAIANVDYVISPTEITTAFDISTSTTAVTITLPIATSVGNGRFYYFFDAGNNATNKFIIIQVAGSSSNTISSQGLTGLVNVTMPSSGMSGFIYTDGASGWYLSFFNQYDYNNQTITYSNSNLDMEASSTISLDSTSILSAGGTNDFTSTSHTTFDSGAHLTVASGAITTLSGDVTVNGNVTQNGTFTANSGIVVNGVLTSTASSTFGFNQATFTLAATGTTTLTAAQYNNVVLYPGIVSLTGDITIVFPNTTGYWILITNGVAFNGHSVTVQQATSGASQVFSPTAANMIIVTSVTGGTIFMGLTQ